MAEATNVARARNNRARNSSAASAARSRSVNRGEDFNAHNLSFARAITKNKPDPWDKGHLWLYVYCSIIYLCSTMNGYDASLMGSINSLPSYQKYYGLPLNGSSATGIVFSIYQIGLLAGSFFVWIADWRGRRWPIFLGSIGVLIGAAITATAGDLGVFVGGRFLLSFFSSWCMTSGPMLVVELAPPHYRATVSGLYNTLWYMGAVIATFSVYGCNLHFGDSNLAFRLPLWLQMLFPGMVCCLIWFVPESPRWLVAAGRHDEARAFFVKHHANGKETHPIVKLQMDEVMQSLRDVPLLHPKTFLDLRNLVRTRARRYRTFLNFVFSWFGQFSGNNVISYYLPLLLVQVGVTKPSTQLLLNAVYAISGWIAATIGARLHDVIGRRKMFLVGTAGMIVCLAIAAGGSAAYVQNGSIAASEAAITFIFVFGVTFAISFTSMQPVYPAEVMTNEMRAKGMFVTQFATGLTSFVNTFVAPIALKNIGYWFYVFFVFWDCFEFAIIYFFFVETNGRTLEELDEVFDDPNPALRSKQVLKLRSIRTTDDNGNDTFDVNPRESAASQ